MVAFGINTLMEQGISILPMGTDDRFIQAGVRRMLAYFRDRTGEVIPETEANGRKS